MPADAEAIGLWDVIFDFRRANLIANPKRLAAFVRVLRGWPVCKGRHCFAENLIVRAEHWSIKLVMVIYTDQRRTISRRICPQRVGFARVIVRQAEAQIP